MSSVSNTASTLNTATAPQASRRRGSPPPTIQQIITHRRKQRQRQREFWLRSGVIQSQGSRFESGAEIPPAVVLLLGLYFNNTIGDNDLSIVSD